jgi:hypothetical protein
MFLGEDLVEVTVPLPRHVARALEAAANAVSAPVGVWTGGLILEHLREDRGPETAVQAVSAAGTAAPPAMPTPATVMQVLTLLLQGDRAGASVIMQGMDHHLLLGVTLHWINALGVGEFGGEAWLEMLNEGLLRWAQAQDDPDAE